MILHIISKSDWEEASDSSDVGGPSLETEGFLHCSRPDQVAEIASSNFLGRTDLLLLKIDPDKLTMVQFIKTLFRKL